MTYSPRHMNAGLPEAVSKSSFFTWNGQLFSTSKQVLEQDATSLTFPF